MGKITNAINEIHELDEMAEKNTKIHQIHPMVKLTITIIYITCVVSIEKYNILRLIPMVLYPAIVFYLSDISISTCFKKMKVVLPIILFVGIWNPLFDRQPVLVLGDIYITGGIISMITIMIKGIYALMASFLLIATTGMEGICYALRILHVPNIIVTQILLSYRYIFLLMDEANSVFEAYSLRAPKEKGVKYKVWGSLLGQLLFRSIDRAGSLYESMLLRGYDGFFRYAATKKCTKTDYIYLCVWILMIVLLRM
jgi:cobalt/nickel transport system permease protein